MSENQSAGPEPGLEQAELDAPITAGPQESASEVRPVSVAPLEVPSSPGDKPAIRGSAIDSVKVSLSVEVGRVDLSLREVRATKQGGVINLDRMIGDPLDVRINGRLIARGEIVATEGQKYGIRITEMVNADERDDED